MKWLLMLCLNFHSVSAFSQVVDAYESPYPELVSSQNGKSFIEIAYEQNVEEVDHFLTNSLSTPECEIVADRMWTETQVLVTTLSRKYFACNRTAVIKYRCEFNRIKKGVEAGLTEVSCEVAKMRIKK